MNQFEQKQIPKLESPQRFEARKENESTKIVDSVLGNTRDDIQEALAVPEKNKRLSAEEREKLFTEDILSHLPLEKYLELWRQGSPYFVSHVTRQGFRDHNAMIYHSGGMNEFASGFNAITNDGKRLHSPFYIDGLKELTKEEVRGYLEKYGILSAENNGKALQMYKSLMHYTLASAPKYPDKTAVHLVVEDVLDDYYGGETSNEIFVIYPADFAASQGNYSFNGWEKDFTNPQSEAKWNDLFIWQKGKEGLAVDAGIVFLPENTPVDPETGSRYASQKNDNGELGRVEDKSQINKLLTWYAEKASFIKLALDRNEKESRKDSWGFATPNNREDLDNFIVNEMISLGMSKEDAYRSIYDIIHMVIGTYGKGDDLKKRQTEFLKSMNLIYKRPENPVTAKEYWEQYFTKNPRKKPKHVVYYNGNPTVAVRKYMQNNGISPNGRDSQLLDFDENHISDISEDERAWEGIDEIDKFATEIIEESYLAKAA